MVIHRKFQFFALIEKLHLTSIVYNADEIKKLKDEDNPPDPIDEIHSPAKRFMKQHSGYDFMNLVAFILNEPYDRYKKIDLLALNSPKKVKYRDVMSK